MSDAEQAARSFCSALFAHYDGGGHQAVVTSWPGPSVTWVSDPDPGDVATAIRAADARDGAEATYVAMTLLAPGTARHRTGRDGELVALRGSAGDVSVVLGVWADLDIAGSAHVARKRYPPDADTIGRILKAAGLRPTMVWRSGHGLQAFWRFHEPWVLTDGDDPARERREAATLVRNWQLTIAVHAHRLGRWQFDSTADLARVLRPAGTMNRKIADDHRPVEVLTIDETAEYNPSDIEDFTLDARELEQFAGMADVPANAPVNKVNLTALWALCRSQQYRQRRYLPEWLAVMLEDQTISEGHRLLQVWDEGHPSGDSETDASLARHTAKLSLDERDAVEIIMCHRLRTGAKLEKVDPGKRTDYVRRTVARAFAEERKQRAEQAARREQGNEWAAEAAAQAGPPDDTPALEEGPQRRPALESAGWDEEDSRPTAAADDVPRPVQDAMTGTASLPHGLGGAIAAGIDADTFQTRPDPGPAPDPPPEEPEPDDVPDPSPGAPEPEPTDAPSAGTAPEPDDAPADDPTGQPIDEPTDDPAPDLGADPDLGEPATLPGTAASSAGGDGQSDGASGGSGSGEPTPIGAAHGAWGSRTELQNKVLRALSETLLGDQAGWAQIWRLQTRGRGAKAERRLILRFKSGTRFAMLPPVGYVDGLPYATGWFPAGSFGKVAGFARALEQDAKLHSVPVKQDDFANAFGKVLVQMWEPDDSGGSLDNVTRAGLLSYLLDYPPVPSWNDAAQQGMPFISEHEPRWSTDAEFTVLVRWADYGAHVRSHFGINTPPSVLADMAELAGARPIRTLTQDGRWRVVRRAYFTDEEWRGVLSGAEVAEQRREDRHGMRVVPGGRDDEGPTGPNREDDYGGDYRDEPGKRRPYEGWG